MAALPEYCVCVELLAADTNRELIAAPATGQKLKILEITCTGITSSANTVTVQDNSGTVVLMKFASLAANAQLRNNYGGKELTAAEKLKATCTAGPAAWFVIRYQIVPA